MIVGGVLLMSGEERERLVVVQSIFAGSLLQWEGAERLGIGLRQLKRLLRSWREHGDRGLGSRLRVVCGYVR